MNAPSRFHVAVALLVLTALSAFASRIIVDFGDLAANRITAGGPPYYVNVTNPFWTVNKNTAVSYENIADTNGVGTGITLVMSNWYQGSNQNGPTTNSFDYPSTAVIDNVFNAREAWAPNNAGGTGYVYLTGLEVNKYYKFTIFAARVGTTGNREAQYRFYADGVTDTSVYLNAVNNYTQRALTGDLKPNANGQILLEVGPGPNNDNVDKFVYLGVLDISIIPEPAAALALAAFALLRLRR